MRTMNCLLYIKMISLEIVELSTLHANYSIKNDTGIHSIIEVIKNMSATERSLFGSYESYLHSACGTSNVFYK